ncbi:MAG: recombinase family protein [Chloroflexota bacterium]
MPKIRYQPQKIETTEPLPGHTTLPLDRPVANYYRQSSLTQVGNIATEMQTVDMAVYLERLGWGQEQIIMIDMDKGVSGTTKIDEREGMKMLFELITTDQIGAVACQDEDRLFRDVTQIQVNIFIEACRAHNVLVITPSVHYDFAHPLHGVFHARQFRFKSEMAADYINSVVMGRLKNARTKLLQAGLWAGGPIPSGFMIDMREKLDSGAQNPHYRKYVEFEPFAEIVREYFNLFIAHNGCRNSTLRHIRHNGPYLPDPKTCIPPDGFQISYRIKRQENGQFYICSRDSLAWMFSNAIYIGHWIHQRTVTIWNNHEAIIDPKIFFRTFNYVSASKLSGEENEHYRPFRMYAPRGSEAERSEDKPLCIGLMLSELNGELRRVGTQWRNNIESYCYTLVEYDGLTNRIWSRISAPIDKAVADLLLVKLRETFTKDKWVSEIDGYMSLHEKQQKTQQKQLTHLKTVMDNLLASLETLSNPQMIANVEKRYQEAQTEYERLQQEMSESHEEDLDIETLRELKVQYTEAIEKWDEYDADHKRAAFQVFIHKIIATPGDHLSLHLEIHWNDDSTDEVTIESNARHARKWTQEEVGLLVKVGKTEKNPLTIASHFPERKWRGLRWKFHQMTGQHLPFSLTYDIGPEDTYNSYMRREELRKAAGIKRVTGAGTKWTPEEIDMLIELGKAKADPLTIASQFPGRKWRAIRWKYLSETGDNLPHSSKDLILPEETFFGYQARKGIQVVHDEPDDNRVCLEGNSTRGPWP